MGAEDVLAIGVEGGGETCSFFVGYGEKCAADVEYAENCGSRELHLSEDLVDWFALNWLFLNCFVQFATVHHKPILIFRSFWYNKNWRLVSGCWSSANDVISDHSFQPGYQLFRLFF